LAYYRATNLADRAIIGQATFNVTPDKAGRFFDKIECFCFTDQRLAAGETVDMPVSFFVDPEIVEDRDMDEVKTITLSYTFFFVSDDAEAKAEGAERASRALGDAADHVAPADAGG
jgi:cytochrome c oxidase assembly protein subunit 11